MKANLLAIITLVAAVAALSLLSAAGTTGNAASIVVYKTPNCGCCSRYAAELQRAGFSVETRIVDDISSIKGSRNIPAGMESCHTAVADGYFIEGHVPLEAVRKLLEEKPDIDGIALPEMPAGSPGMPGTKLSPFVVYSLKNGKASVFMRI